MSLNPRSDLAVDLVIHNNPGMFRKDFRKWISENWGMWLAFDEQASKIRAVGHEFWSARTIVHWIRHETGLREVAGGFKINNNFSPDMARLWEEFHPQAKGFFALRARTALLAGDNDGS